MKISRNKGFTLVEVVIGVSIISMMLVGVSQAYFLYLRNTYLLTERIQGAFLAEEGIEALKAIRDFSWSQSFATYSTTTDYYLFWNLAGTLWQATTVPQVIDGTFYRTFRMSWVSRGADDDIISSGGTNDPNTRLLKVTVSWPSQKGTTTAELSTYITNLFSN